MCSVLEADVVDEVECVGCDDWDVVRWSAEGCGGCESEVPEYEVVV